MVKTSPSFNHNYFSKLRPLSIQWCCWCPLNLFISDILVRDYWMGLKYSTNEQRWKWSETDAEVMFFDWYPGEPNSDTENCVVFGDTISYRWADVRCLSTRNVLCELVKWPITDGRFYRRFVTDLKKSSNSIWPLTPYSTTDWTNTLS